MASSFGPGRSHQDFWTSAFWLQWHTAMAQHGPGPGEGAGPPLHRFLDALTFESIAKKGYRGRKFGGIFEIKCGRKCEIHLRLCGKICGNWLGIVGNKRLSTNISRMETAFVHIMYLTCRDTVHAWNNCNSWDKTSCVNLKDLKSTPIRPPQNSLLILTFTFYR